MATQPLGKPFPSPASTFPPARWLSETHWPGKKCLVFNRCLARAGCCCLQDEGVSVCVLCLRNTHQLCQQPKG